MVTLCDTLNSREELMEPLITLHWISYNRLGANTHTEIYVFCFHLFLLNASQVCVLSVLQYRLKCRTPLEISEESNNRYMRIITGISNKQQGQTGPETALVKVMRQCLEWLGHVA